VTLREILSSTMGLLAPRNVVLVLFNLAIVPGIEDRWFPMAV
jgi:hypothetical protein